MKPPAFVRESGGGPAVLCLHSSGASSRQWDALAARLAARHRVLAADLAGHGKSPGWGAGEAPSLDGEVERLAPAVASAEGPLHLVGHSYGAAVAMKLALAHPGRVASLALYEPVLFRLLLDAPGGHPGGEEIVRAAGVMRAALEAGDGEASARTFFEYWSGAGAWSRVEASARATIAERMPVVMGCFDALFNDRTPRSALLRLDVPVLLMNGTASPASSRGVAALLEAALPDHRRVVLDGVGHMGPVTHAGRVNEAIEGFLALQAAPGPRAGASRFAPVAARPAFA